MPSIGTGQQRIFTIPGAKAIPRLRSDAMICGLACATAARRATPELSRLRPHTRPHGGRALPHGIWPGACQRRWPQSPDHGKAAAGFMVDARPDLGHAPTARRFSAC